MKLHHDERGLKGVELGSVLVLIGVLAVMAAPLFGELADRVTEVAAASDARTAVIEEVTDVDGEPDAFDGVEVAGVVLERAEDGSTCRWTVSETGAFFGVWENGADSRSGRFASKPERCPTAAEVEGSGFGD